jgi:hypothetical protein
VKFDYNKWLWDEAHKAAAEWYQNQCRDIYARFYLYYKRGGLKLMTEAANGWELGSAERISTNQTIEQLTARIVETARRLPCLPVENGGGA